MKETFFKRGPLDAPMPWSREQAIELGYTRYMRPYCERCEIAGRMGQKAYYVKNDRCTYCTNIDVHKAWQLWCQGEPGRPDPWNTDPTAGVAPDWFFGATATHGLVCENGPHLRKHHKLTGRCVDCERDSAELRRVKSGPRAKARAAGHSEYIPDHTCPQCNTAAPRNVVTNACSGCKRDDARGTDSTRMAREQPDMMVSRDDARLFGFTLYRTGTACRKGHTGWRYVSTGNCADCRK